MRSVVKSYPLLQVVDGKTLAARVTFYDDRSVEVEVGSEHKAYEQVGTARWAKTLTRFVWDCDRCPKADPPVPQQGSLSELPQYEWPHPLAEVTPVGGQQVVAGPYRGDNEVTSPCECKTCLAQQGVEA